MIIVLIEAKEGIPRHTPDCISDHCIFKFISIGRLLVFKTDFPYLGHINGTTFQ